MYRGIKQTYFHSKYQCIFLNGSWPKRCENVLQLEDFDKFLFWWVLRLITLAGIGKKRI